MFLNRIKDYFDRKTRSVIVQSLVLSIMNYCISIWGTTNATQLKHAQKLQNFAAKIVDGKARKYDHVTPVLKDLQWLYIKDKIIYDTGITMFKYVNRLYPNDFLTFRTIGDVTGSLTRQHNHLYVKKTNTDSGARSLLVRGAKLWNNLPSKVKEANTLNSFKTKLRIEILQGNML